MKLFLLLGIGGLLGAWGIRYLDQQVKLRAVTKLDLLKKLIPPREKEAA